MEFILLKMMDNSQARDCISLSRSRIRAGINLIFYLIKNGSVVFLQYSLFNFLICFILR